MIKDGRRTKPVTWLTFLPTRPRCCPPMPNLTILANSKWATLTIALFTWRPMLLCLQGREDDICKIWAWPFLIYNALLGLNQGILPSATAVHPPPSPRVSLGSGPVVPYHRHKRLLPNWFVSLSVKPWRYCCPAHLPLLDKAQGCVYSQIHSLHSQGFIKLLAWKNLIW